MHFMNMLLFALSQFFYLLACFLFMLYILDVSYAIGECFCSLLSFFYFFTLIFTCVLTFHKNNTGSSVIGLEKKYVGMLKHWDT